MSEYRYEQYYVNGTQLKQVKVYYENEDEQIIVNLYEGVNIFEYIINRCINQNLKLTYEIINSCNNAIIKDKLSYCHVTSYYQIISCPCTGYPHFSGFRLAEHKKSINHIEYIIDKTIYPFLIKQHREQIKTLIEESQNENSYLSKLPLELIDEINIWYNYYYLPVEKPDVQYVFGNGRN